jgi:hypothetical protein
MDGSSKKNAMATIQGNVTIIYISNGKAGINSASYGDTVKLVEGSYAGTGNYGLNPNGKAITITSVLTYLLPVTNIHKGIRTT